MRISDWSSDVCSSDLPCATPVSISARRTTSRTCSPFCGQAHCPRIECWPSSIHAPMEAWERENARASDLFSQCCKCISLLHRQGGEAGAHEGRSCRKDRKIAGERKRVSERVDH